MLACRQRLAYPVALLCSFTLSCSQDATDPAHCDASSCSASQTDAASHQAHDARVAASRDAGDAGAGPVSTDPSDDDAGSPNAAPDYSGDPGTVDSQASDDADYVFDQTALRDYNFVVAAEDLAKIDAAPANEEYVQGTLEFEGKTYGPLGVRYKGSIGAFLSPCTSAVAVGQTPGAKVGKCSMKLDFNHVDDDARFYGLKQLNFHSMGQDPSQLRDRLGYAMFRELGVAAPRAVHARVFINGQLEGLFVVVEQVDGRFTRSRFSEGGEGNLYKEVWPTHDDATTYQQALETNEDQGAVQKMLDFKQAIAEGSAAIDDWLDRDYMLRYLAVDRVIINDDGALHWYCASSTPDSAFNHNFYWYEAEHAKRMWLVPWDLDSSFANGSYVHINPAWDTAAACSCGGNPAQLPASCDTLIHDWTSWNSDLQAKVQDFLSGPFSDSNVSAKLTAWTQQIDAASQASSGVKGAPIYFLWQAAVSGLRNTISSARLHHGYDYD